MQFTGIREADAARQGQEVVHVESTRDAFAPQHLRQEHRVMSGACCVWCSWRCGQAPGLSQRAGRHTAAT